MQETSQSNQSIELTHVSVDKGRELVGGLGHSKFYELIAEGKIDAFKAGRRTLISVASIRRYLNSLPQTKSVLTKTDQTSKGSSRKRKR